MLRSLVILCALVSTGMAERTLVGPANARTAGAFVSQVTAEGTVRYTDPAGRQVEARLAGIVPPQPNTKASADFVLFANYMTRQSRSTVVHKAGRGGVDEVQVILPDGRDLGYLLIIGRYVQAHPVPEASPTLYLVAKKALQPDAIETLAARPQP